MRRALYEISLDGQNISTTLNPILLSLSIRETDQDEADSLTMELDDTGGQIALPAEGAPITAVIYAEGDGQGVRFEGFLDGAHSSGDEEGQGRHHGRHQRHRGGGGGTVQASGSRSSGRTLTVSAKSADMTGKLKERTSAHKDKGTFGDVAKAWGQKAGLSDVKVDAKLAAVQRDYWAMAHESYMMWGTRMARELGATFKVMGGTAVFVSRTGGTAADGQALTGITAAWGVNLIAWDISPTLSRPSYGMAEATYYDLQQARTATEQSSAASSSGAKATHRHKHKVGTKDQAKQQAEANKGELDREKGVGSITIDGEPAAQAGAMCAVVGIRPGVDGSYVISQVTQHLARGSGWTTHCELKLPSGGAGSDTRGGPTNQPASPAALA